MTTSVWVTIVVSIGGFIITAAVAWGSLKNELGNCKTALSKLEGEFIRSREDQGKRLGRLETAEAVQRHITQARGIKLPPPPDDSGPT